MRSWYRIHDWDQERKKEGAQLLGDKKSVTNRNKEGYGIFWSVNDFNGARKEENLYSINSFYCDVDGINKEDVLTKVSIRLPPSMIVETKSGFHLYWFLKLNIRDNPTEEMISEYKDILKNRLVPYFCGDPNATDVTRILRVPNFLHQKNPTKPFHIKCLLEELNFYSYKDLVQSFSRVETFKKEKKVNDKTDFWGLIGEINCVDALERISGTHAVAGEEINLRPYKDKYQIYINNKSTSCWIDPNGKIGSRDKGGPTIANWLYWYHQDWRKVAEIIKEFFPEVQNDM